MGSLLEYHTTFISMLMRREFTFPRMREEYEELLKLGSLKCREQSNTCRDDCLLCFDFIVYVNLRYQFNKVEKVCSVAEIVKLYVLCNICLIFLSTLF